MFGFRKPPPPNTTSTGSETEPDKNTTLTPARRTSSEPVLVPKSKGNYFDEDDDDDWGRKPTSTATSAASKAKYKTGFKDSGGLENQSVQELENYAVYKSEETTNSVNNCLRIAEDIRSDATRTLDMLHQQGDQINRTHNMVVDTEKDLSKVGLFCSFQYRFVATVFAVTYDLGNIYYFKSKHFNSHRVKNS